MAKLENYVELAAQTVREISADGETWRSFLQTASTLYKYSFYDQVMIYAQRPDATACASFELWTNTMRRYVRRGAKGIALLDMTGDVPRYHYVFDAADTGMRKDSRSPFVWTINEENGAAIGALLEKEYEVSANRGDGRSVFFANCPCKRRSGVLPGTGIRYVKNVAVARHVAGHIPVSYTHLSRRTRAASAFAHPLLCRYAGCFPCRR